MAYSRKNRKGYSHKQRLLNCNQPISNEKRPKMIIRAKNFKQWMKVNLKDYLEDIVNHGCSGGFPYLTYYSDTVKLYEHFKEEIWESLCNDAEEYGSENVYEFIAGFNKDFQPSDYTTMCNQLVWYIAEKSASELLEEK
jgi:hypothetical protein